MPVFVDVNSVGVWNSKMWLGRLQPYWFSAWWVIMVNFVTKPIKVFLENEPTLKNQSTLEN